MKAAACSWVSLAMAGMMLPRVMMKRLSTRSALIVGAGVHEVAAFDDRPAVRGHFHVVEIEGAVLLDPDVFQEGVAFEAGVVGFDLLAGVQGVGLDEQSARPRSRGNGRRG